MRKAIVICVTVLFLLPSILTAQAEFATDKGSMLVGGSASFTSSGGDAQGDDRYNILQINTKIMYFIALNLAIGGNFQFINQSYGDDSQTSVAIGPTIAYFFGQPDSRTIPFIGASFTYGNVSDAYSQTSFSVGGGMVFMFARNIGLTTEASYQFESYSPEGSSDSVSGNTFGIALGISAFIY